MRRRLEKDAALLGVSVAANTHTHRKQSNIAIKDIGVGKRSRYGCRRRRWPAASRARPAEVLASNDACFRDPAMRGLR